MFKNPLKYQQGGQLNEQQQQVLAAFIDWLPKRVKEFQGMKPEAIVQALDGMSKTPEGQKQVQQLMKQFQQESQSGQSFKRGGKVQDFICKHAKGGVAGCGCEKPVEKHQQENGKGRGIIDFPQYTVAQDTTFLNPRGEKINQKIIVDKNGQAYKWNTVNGINPIVIGGYWDGQFTPEGDDTIPVQRFDSLFRRAIPKQNSQSNQNVVKDQNPAGPILNTNQYVPHAKQDIPMHIPPAKPTINGKPIRFSRHQTKEERQNFLNKLGVPIEIQGDPMKVSRWIEVYHKPTFMQVDTSSVIPNDTTQLHNYFPNGYLIK